MSNVKKLMMSAAGGGGGLNVEEVFSTYLYEGDGTSSQTVTNGIDFSGEGGLLWIKARDPGNWHTLFDTERPITQILSSNSATVTTNSTGWGLTSFNSDGFSVNAQSMLAVNNSGNKNCSWSFRKAPKFFDIVTYTGNGTAGRQISHNLGSQPGCIIIKRTDATTDWFVWHRSASPQDYRYFMNLQATAQWQSYGVSVFGSSSSYTFNDSVFTVGDYSPVNQNGNSYVAYIFAHNNGDGEFGPTGDQDIIKCGTFTGGYEKKVDLGFRPQWVMIKRQNSNGSWHIFDKMRGWHANPTYQSKTLKANNTNTETSQILFWPTADGFQFDDISAEVNYPNGEYVYVAIKDETRPPEDATDCFDVNLFAGTGSNNELQAGTGWNADMVWVKPRTLSGYGNAYWARHFGGNLSYGNYLQFNSSGAFTQNANSAFSFYEKNNHYTHGADGYGFQNKTGNYIDYVFKNTEGFFDSGVYLGPAVSSGAIAHRLGVKPELIYIKNTESNYDEVLGLQFGSSSYKESLYPMDYNYSSTSYSTTTNFGAEPDADNFYVNDNNKTGASSQRYSYQAFATLAGISKLGTYTGTGSTQTINCAFSNGARFVMIKDLGGNSHWYMFTSDQGISSSSNDPYLLWGNSDSEVTNTNFLNAASSGFALNGSNTLNTNGSTYFFLAIA